MLFQTAEKYISSARLIPYKQAVSGNEQAALQLYLDNLRAAQSFYASLSLLEVAFRNSLHEVLAKNFASGNWVIEQQRGFMIDPALTYLDRKLNRTVTNDKVLRMAQTAVSGFRQQRRVAPPDGRALIPELPFGFWTTLFTHRYYFLLHQSPLRAFPNRPRGTIWQTINTKLSEVRIFRNRVYHYEPLCFQGKGHRVLCLSQLEQIHATICELLGWIDPTLPPWLAEVDRAPEILQKLKRRYPAAS